jgi:hypothetical protein
MSSNDDPFTGMNEMLSISLAKPLKDSLNFERGPAAWSA